MSRKKKTNGILPAKRGGRKQNQSIIILHGIPDQRIERLFELIQPSTGKEHPLAKRVFKRVVDLHMTEVEENEVIQTLIDEYVSTMKQDFIFLNRLREEINLNELLGEHRKQEKQKEFAHKALIFTSGGHLPKKQNQNEEANGKEVESNTSFVSSVLGPTILLNITLVPATIALLPIGGTMSYGLGTLLAFLLGSGISFSVFSLEGEDSIDKGWRSKLPIPGLLILGAILLVRLITSRGIEDVFFSIAMAVIEVAALMLVKRAAKKHASKTLFKEKEVKCQQESQSKSEKWQAEYDRLTKQTSKIEKLTHLLSIPSFDIEGMTEHLHVLSRDAMARGVAHNINKLFSPEKGGRDE